MPQDEVHQDDLVEIDDTPPPRERRGPSTYLIVLALVVATLGALGFIFLEHRPLAAERDALRGRHHRAETERSTMHQRAREQRERADGLAMRLRAAEAENARLQRELDATRQSASALRAAHEQTEAELAEIRAAQDSLRARLQREIDRGEILVRQDRGELGIELSQDVLFAVGEAQLNDAGRQVLRRVAESLQGFGSRVIQVAGHTDSAPVVSERRERFPTNWELSTARATSVVRFLQDECGVPGERLVAAGHAQYQPAASNRNAVGRRRNRRIELTLLPARR